MAIFQRLCDVVHALFFLAHLATALLLDTQVLFERSTRTLFPSVLVESLGKYVKDYKDPLMAPSSPVWFRSILYLEIIAMVPFLVVGLLGAILGARWMRTPSIVYGTALFTIVVPMLGHILFENFEGVKNTPRTQEERYVLAGIYGIYGLFGLFIAFDHALLRCKPDSTCRGRIGDTEKNDRKKRN